MLPARCWKRPLQLITFGGVMKTGVVSQRQTNTCLPIFCCLRAERKTRQRRPLFQLKPQRLMLPARHWKRQLQLITCEGDANGSVFTTANKYLFSDLLFFIVGEGGEATSPLFQLKTQGLMLLAPCWKLSLQHS